MNQKSERFCCKKKEKKNNKSVFHLEKELIETKHNKIIKKLGKIKERAAFGCCLLILIFCFLFCFFFSQSKTF